MKLSEITNGEGLFCDRDWVESKDQDKNGEIRLIQLADIRDGYFRDKSNRYLTLKSAIELNCTFLNQGDILLARMPDPLGRCCIFPLVGKKKYVTVVDVCIIRPNSKFCNRKFLSHVLNAPQIRKSINDLESGTTRKRISRKNLNNIKLPVPPINDQEQIVSKIDELFSELDKSIEELKTAQQQLKVYRQAVLKWAFEGKLTNEVSNDSKLPKGWKKVSLSKAIEQPKYGTSKKCDYQILGKGVLRIPNIKNGAVDDSDLQYAEFDDQEVKTYSLREGDLLVIRSNGSVDIVGQSALITKNNEDYLYAGYLIRLRPIASEINSKYLLHLLSSSNLRNQIEAKAKSTSGVNNINSEELMSLDIVLCSIEEQQQIVEEIETRLSVCDKIEETITNSMKQGEALRQSILKKAFEGNL